jgi:hypothetical protein
MSNFLSKVISPTSLLYIYLILTSIALGIYLGSQIEPPAVFTLIYSAGFLWIVGWWLLTDSRKRGVAWVYDIGFFLYIAWPFIMPYQDPRFETETLLSFIPCSRLLMEEIKCARVNNTPALG